MFLFEKKKKKGWCPLTLFRVVKKKKKKAYSYIGKDGVDTNPSTRLAPDTPESNTLASIFTDFLFLCVCVCHKIEISVKLSIMPSSCQPTGRGILKPLEKCSTQRGRGGRRSRKRGNYIIWAFWNEKKKWTRVALLVIAAAAGCQSKREWVNHVDYPLCRRHIPLECIYTISYNTGSSSATTLCNSPSSLLSIFILFSK